MLKDKISIIGAGGHCRPLLDVLLEKFEKKNLSIYDLFFSNDSIIFLGTFILSLKL